MSRRSRRPASTTIFATTLLAALALSVPANASAPDPASISLTPAVVDFGAVTVGNTPSATLTVTNTGGSYIGHPTVTINGANANLFSVANNNCPLEIEMGKTCTFDVKFSPTAAGAASAAITVAGSGLALADGDPLAIPPPQPVSAATTLTGTGVVPTPKPSVVSLKVSSSKPRKAVNNLAFGFNLSDAATVTLTIQRKYGRTQQKQCKRTTSKTRLKKRCPIYRDAATRTFQLQPGDQTVKYNAKSLSPGAYRAEITATNAGGSSAPAKVIFYRPWWN